MKNIIRMIMLTAALATFNTHASTLSGKLTIEEGSTFSMYNGFWLVVPIVGDPGDGLVLNTYQPFILNPDIPVLNGNGTGYGAIPANESDILAPFIFGSSGVHTGTNPISYQTGAAHPLPTVDVDAFGNLTGHLEAWEVMWNGSAFIQQPRDGSAVAPIATVATGFYDVATGKYYLDWNAIIVGGPFNNVLAKWHLEGQVQVVPVPASIWLLSSGLLFMLRIARR